jgi:hypothetical protein
MKQKGNEARRQKKERELEKIERKSRILRDLRVEYDTRPEEIGADGGVKTTDSSSSFRKYEERRQYEEENFLRLNETKEDKKFKKQYKRRGMIQGLQNDFKVCIRMVRLFPSFANVKFPELW